MLYYFPNRPTLVPPDPTNPMNPKPDYINGLETSGNYIAELKWNGDNTLIYTRKNQAPILYNRHKDVLSYHPSEAMLEALNTLPPDCVVNAELMHRHTKVIKDLLIIHCVMVWKGSLLNGKKWVDSRLIIEDMDYPRTEVGKFQYDNPLVISEIYYDHFWDLFQGADVETIEGIILKNPNGKLKFSTTPLKDVPWMIKIRKPCKKYSF